MKRVVPYILLKVNNKEEFIEIQKQLFKKNYKWLNDSEVWYNELLSFPFYLSNLPHKNKGDRKKQLEKRKNFNEFDNNIIFFDNIKTNFDVKYLRIDKLISLNKNIYE